MRSAELCAVRLSKMWNAHAIVHHLEAHGCPWICCRVFKLKLEMLKKDLFERNVLGRVVGFTYVIDFQKRGLPPQAHMLIVLHPDDKLRTADKVICAEICDESMSARKELRAKQLRHMVHSCRDKCFGEDDPQHENCANSYPRNFCKETADSEAGYPNYRRRTPADGDMSDDDDEDWPGLQAVTYTDTDDEDTEDEAEGGPRTVTLSKL